jgi:hypothetical protein
MIDIRSLALRLSVGVALALPASAYASVSVLSISDSISASIEGVSDSISGSSKSSAKTVKMAQGDYKIVAIAQADGMPGKQRLTLQAANGNQGENLYMYLANAEFQQAHLSNGQLVTASRRPYGLAFAKSGSKEPFAVVLMADWLKDVPSNEVVSKA